MFDATFATYTNTLVALAVDEAHCITTWLVVLDSLFICYYFRGKDFCAAFNHIDDLWSMLIIVLTATAKPEVLRTVKHKLCLEDPVVIGLASNREDIKYFIEPLPNIEVLCKLFALYAYWYFLTGMCLCKILFSFRSCTLSGSYL